MSRIAGMNVVGIAIAVLVVGTLGLFMLGFTVRFNQIAVVETFGRISTVHNAPGDDEGAGWHWRWPTPIQRVYNYDRRLFSLDDKLEELETADRQTVIARMALVWRIDDPKAFHRQFKSADVRDSISKVESLLRDRMRAARSILSGFTLEQLTTEEDRQVMLDEASDQIRQQIQQSLDAQQDTNASQVDFGVEIVEVTIERLIFPQSVTEQVFERMTSTRERMAQAARSRGEGVSRSIISRAEQDRRRILDWAQYYANQIRNRGEREALQYWERFDEHEELAIFVKKIETLRQTLEQNTTILLDTDDVPYEMLKPQNIDNLSEGIGSPDAQTDGQTE